MFYSVKLFFVFVNSNQKVTVFLDPVFGTVPPPEVLNASSSAKFTFTIDTVEGRPVTSTEAAKIFLLPKPLTSLNFKDRSYAMATNVGFDTQVTTHTKLGTTFNFKDDKRDLSVDITNFNFSYQYTFQSDPGLFADAQPIDPENATTAAVEFLNKMDRYPAELAQGKTNKIYFKYDPATGNLANVSDPKDANVVEVDFYRPDIDGLPIVTSSYYNSQNYVTLMSNGNGTTILRAQIKFYDKSTAQVGTYPVITGDVAYLDKLQKGQGIVVAVDQAATVIKIKKMFVGYLDPTEYQPYLEPVYVFLGDNNFVGYVPAVTDQYLSTGSEVTK